MLNRFNYACQSVQKSLRTRQSRRLTRRWLRSRRNGLPCRSIAWRSRPRRPARAEEGTCSASSSCSNFRFNAYNCTICFSSILQDRRLESRRCVINQCWSTLRLVLGCTRWICCGRNNSECSPQEITGSSQGPREEFRLDLPGLLLCQKRQTICGI